MRIVLQRVQFGAVRVEGQIVGQIDQGYVALVGLTHQDSAAQVELMARKTAQLRVFEDDQGKMNLSLLEVGGGVLVISQFTLYADARRGRRPSFTEAARPEAAAPLIDLYIAGLRQAGVQRVEKGIFGAMMLVEIHNDGPVTIVLDSADFA
jgi:D-tyrosyl-tRNA(Tyr) deacylase